MRLGDRGGCGREADAFRGCLGFARANPRLRGQTQGFARLGFARTGSRTRACLGGVLEYLLVADGAEHSSRASAPAVALTAVRVIRIPTLNASRARLRDLALEDEDEERLLGADPSGADGHQRREAVRHLDEQDVLQRSGRCRTRRGRTRSSRAAGPSRRAARRRPAEIAARLAQDRERAREAGAEVVDARAAARSRAPARRRRAGRGCPPRREGGRAARRSRSC